MFCFRVRRCCFGPFAVNLFVGSFVISWLGIIFHSIIFYIILRNFTGLSLDDWQKLCQSIKLFNLGETWEACPHHVIWFIAFLALCSLIEILVNVLLMMGIITEKSTLFLPFLMCSTFSILVRTTCSIIALMLCSSQFTTDSFLTFLILFCAILVQIYFFIIVKSTFLEMDEIIVDDTDTADINDDTLITYVDPKNIQ